MDRLNTFRDGRKNQPGLDRFPEETLQTGSFKWHENLRLH